MCRCGCIRWLVSVRWHYVYIAYLVVDHLDGRISSEFMKLGATKNGHTVADSSHYVNISSDEILYDFIHAGSNSN